MKAVFDNKTSVELLCREMKEYYTDFNYSLEDFEKNIPAADRKAREKILSSIAGISNSKPYMPQPLLKARLHELIADNFVPRIFTHSPFFFEMGMRHPYNWGTPNDSYIQPGSWLHQHFAIKGPIVELAPFNRHSKPSEQTGITLWGIVNSGFDIDHHCLGYTKLLRTGINGIINEVKKQQKSELSEKQQVELEAMLISCQALIRVAERFREKAAEMLPQAKDSDVRENLEMICQAASNIPANPPENFYEGLAMLLFLRETVGPLESMGISVMGHPDRMLASLYEKDIARGILTYEKAEDLIAKWMLPSDIRTFAREREWPETSSCITLGGCDEEGKVVWNDITRIFIEMHRKYDLMNPKLNCRMSAASPMEYLDIISECVLQGHNNFALLNDDILIPANIRYGKTEKDARRYVNGGCQETMCEGVEHSAGAYYYFCMPQVMHLFFSARNVDLKGNYTEARKVLPPKMNPEEVNSFDIFYRQFLTALIHTMKQGAKCLSARGRVYRNINPCPLLSSMLEGCIENALDYTAGGAKYNLSGITLVGLGDVINSLNAVKKAVFEEKWLSLAEFQQAVSSNWENLEVLRQRIIRLPRYGHGNREVDELAARFCADIAATVRQIPNERGEYFQPSFFVYWSFYHMGVCTGATPDGRKQGEMFCQGVAPHRVNAPQSLTDVFRSVSTVDFRDFPGNAVLDIQLPASRGIPVEAMVSCIKTFCKLGGPTLQFNCVDIKKLKAAQEKPEEHEDLIVRVAGMSARFVRLEKHVQDEIIQRALYSI